MQPDKLAGLYDSKYGSSNAVQTCSRSPKTCQDKSSIAFRAKTCSAGL